MADVLTRICADTAAETDRRRSLVPQSVLEKKCAKAARPRGFAEALKNAIIAGRCGLITEIKRLSPSGGVIRENLDPADRGVAPTRQAAPHASRCSPTRRISADLWPISPPPAQPCRCPCCARIFVLDVWQVFESRAAGCGLHPSHHGGTLGAIRKRSSWSRSARDLDHRRAGRGARREPNSIAPLGLQYQSSSASTTATSRPCETEHRDHDPSWRRTCRPTAC